MGHSTSCDVPDRGSHLGLSQPSVTAGESFPCSISRPRSWRNTWKTRWGPTGRRFPRTSGGPSDVPSCGTCTGNRQALPTGARRESTNCSSGAGTTSSHGGVQPFDLTPLMKLCLTLLDGASYPWSVTQGVDVGLSQPSLDRLSRAGWIQSTDLTSVEVWHDRLLNWSVAEALADKVRTSPATQAEVVQVVAKLLMDPQVTCGRLLGYVPMDFLWIVLGMPSLASAAASAVDAMVAADPNRAHTLYEGLLATLGPRVVPLLVQRLRAAAASGPGYLVRSVASAVAAAGGAAATDAATGLMRDANPLLRRAGSQILALAPAANAVDLAWDVHAAAEANPTSFAWPNEIPREWYKDTFGAVKACATPAGLGRGSDPASRPSARARE